MRLPDTVSTDSVKGSGYEAALAEAERPVCAFYGTELFKAALAKEQSGDGDAAAVLAVLNAACSLRINTSPGRPALVPMTPPGAAFESATLDTFTPDHLRLLESVLEDSANPELRARVADLLWLRRFGAAPYKHALAAVEAYRESAVRLAGGGFWGHVIERLDRAVQLAASLKNGEVYAATVALVERLLDEHGTGAPEYELWALSVLLERGEGDATSYAQVAADAAERAERDENWERARMLWENAAGWRHTARDGPDADVEVDPLPTPNDALVRAAEVHVLQAEAYAVTDGGQLSAPFHIKAAIKRLRQVGGQDTRISELRARLHGAQRYAVRLLQPVSLEGTPAADAANTALDVASEHATQAVAGRTLREALFLLASFVRPRPVSERRALAEELSGRYVLQGLFPLQMANAEGKTIARQPPPLSTSGEEREAALTAEMFQHSTRYHDLVALGRIDPARRQIVHDHAPTLRDLVEILAPSAWVPYGREGTYIRGLHAGLHGDLVVAVHLLIPQIEHAVRVLMEEHGHFVSGLDDQGIQDEHNLNALLFRPELIDLMGEDLVFEMKALLINRFAHNLRNRMAHGLMHDGQFHSGAALYLWALCLRLTCFPLEGEAGE